MLQEYLVELGLNAAKNKGVEAIKQHKIKKALEDYFQRKFRDNYNCTKEEEIDFGGLIEYVSTTFKSNVEKRFFGTKIERGLAHKTIINKSIVYAKSNTKLSEKMVRKVMSEAMNILRDFYRQKVNKDLLLISGEIVDDLTKTISQQNESQTKEIIERIDIVEQKLSVTAPLSLDAYKKLFEDGGISTIESEMNQFVNAMSVKHILFPHYGFEVNTVNGKPEFKSVALSQDAIISYPPNIKCQGTIKIGDRYIKEITPGAIDYATRHQLPIIVDVKTAKKYLGDFEDPSQHEADKLVGEQLSLPPKPFPPAFPCSISFDDEVIFNYLLFRTKEILDDNTIVISNYEQHDFPFDVNMLMHPEQQTIDFSFKKNEKASNKDSLTFAEAIKKIITATKATICLLENDQVFAEGLFKSFDYTGGYDDVDEEIDFLRRVVSIEEYFNKTLKIPNEIYSDDWDAVFYISDLITGVLHSSTWEKFNFTFDMSEDLRQKIMEMEDMEMGLSYHGIANVMLWNELYEIPIIRTFECGKFENLEKLKQKVAVLDDQDTLKIVYVANKDNDNFSDVLDKSKGRYKPH